MPDAVRSANKDHPPPSCPPARQVITATHEALAELPECGEVEVRLGHRALFELALAHIGVSRETRGSVVQLLATAAGASPLHATARSRRWPSIKAGLEGIGLSAEAIARCRQLVLQAAGEAEAALFRLRTMLAPTVTGRHGGHRAGARPPSAAALACLDELSQLLQYLQVCAWGRVPGGWCMVHGVWRREGGPQALSHSRHLPITHPPLPPLQAWGLPQPCLLVDPLLAPHGDAFSGCLFQAHLVQGATGSTTVVAAGGRCAAGEQRRAGGHAWRRGWRLRCAVGRVACLATQFLAHPPGPQVRHTPEGHLGAAVGAQRQRGAHAAAARLWSDLQC